MKKLPVLLVLICLGCNTPAPDTVVHINLINNKQALQITGIDPVILQDINRDTASNWQSLFAVYRMPADTDMKDYQPIQPGAYKLKNNALVYTPDTAFRPQQIYFVRYYNFTAHKSLVDYIKGKTQIGKIQYTDLTFKQ